MTRAHPFVLTGAAVLIGFALAAAPALANMTDSPAPSPPPSSDKTKNEKKTNAPKPDDKPKEIGGRKGPDPTRFGDWEKDGRCVDF